MAKDKEELTPEEKERRRKRGLRPPWKPGQSGNPKGRRAEGEATRRLMKALLKSYKTKDGNATGWDIAIAAFVKQLAKGNAQFHKMLFERSDGPVPTILEQEIKDRIERLEQEADENDDDPSSDG